MGLNTTVDSLLVSRLRAQVESRLLRRVVRGLRSLTEIEGEVDGMEFPNVWERICAQKQTSPWHWWTVYEREIDRLLRQDMARLLPHEMLSVWFMTEEGFDWHFDNSDCGSLPTISSDVQDQVATYLTQQVLSHACDWENRRVFEYVNSPSRFD